MQQCRISRTFGAYLPPRAVALESLYGLFFQETISFKEFFEFLDSFSCLLPVSRGIPIIASAQGGNSSGLV